MSSLIARAGRLLDALFLLRLRRKVPGLDMAPGAVVDRRAHIIVRGPGDRVTMGRGAILRHGVYLSTFGAFAEFRDGASIGPYCVLYAQGGLVIGRSVSMGPGCVISTGGHVFDAPGSIRAQGFTKAPIHIGDGVWLGANATVTEGVTIGDDAIVAAGAVVVSDVPRGAIAGGVPARVLRFRPGYEPAG
jgi:acetyltransferase-like isoleucine patch superfamily enzyme